MTRNGSQIPSLFSLTARIVVFAGMAMIVIGGFGRTATAQPEAAGAIQAIEEKPSEGGRAAAATTQAQGKVFGQTRTGSATTRKTGSKSATSKTIPKRPAPAGVDSAKYDGMVIGDKYSFLNFEIAEKIQPVWTLAAKKAGALGLVQVEVFIDTDGRVLTARARTGNQMLHPEAEKAALATRFNRPTIYGKPARALGFVVYRFGRVEDASEEDGGPPKEDPNEPVPDHVIDGIINREAIVLPKLGYQLKPGEGGGMVYVSITVDENGNVIEAWGDSPYDPALKSALEKAARGAKFKPRLVRGHPVKVKATLAYELKPGK